MTTTAALDYDAMARAWALRNGDPDELTPEQIATCVRIFRPALLAMARERRAGRKRPARRESAA